MSKTRLYLKKIQSELNQNNQTPSAIFYKLIEEYKAHLSKNSQSKYLILVDSLLQFRDINIAKRLAAADKKSIAVIDEKSSDKTPRLCKPLPLDLECTEIITRINTYFTKITFDKDSEFAAIIKAFLLYFNDHYRQFLSENFQQKIPVEETVLSLLDAPVAIQKLKERYTEDKIHDQKNQVVRLFSSITKDKKNDEPLKFAQESISSLSLIITQTDRPWLIEYYKYQIDQKRNPESLVNLGYQLGLVGLNGTEEQLNNIFEYALNKLDSWYIGYVYAGLLCLMAISDKLTISQMTSSIISLLNSTKLYWNGNDREKMPTLYKRIVKLINQFLQLIPELEWNEKLQTSLLKEFESQAGKQNERIKFFPEFLYWLKIPARIEAIKNIIIQVRNIQLIPNSEALKVFAGILSELPETSRDEIILSLMGNLIYHPDPTLKVRIIKVLFEMNTFNARHYQKTFDVLMTIDFSCVIQEQASRFFSLLDNKQKHTLINKWLNDLNPINDNRILLLGIFTLCDLIVSAPQNELPNDFKELIKKDLNTFIERLRPLFKPGFYERFQNLIKQLFLPLEEILTLISQQKDIPFASLAKEFLHLFNSISSYIDMNHTHKFRNISSQMLLSITMAEPYDIKLFSQLGLEIAFSNWKLLPPPQKSTALDTLHHCTVSTADELRTHTCRTLHLYSNNLTHLQAMQLITILCDRLNDPVSPISQNEYRYIVKAVRDIFYEKESERLVNTRLNSNDLSSIVMSYTK